MSANFNLAELYAVDFEEFSKHPEIDPETVVSLDEEGRPLSRFGDSMWDFTLAQGPKLFWETWAKGNDDPAIQKLTDQLKSVFYTVILAFPQGKLRQHKKSYKRYQGFLVKLARMMHLTGADFASAQSHNIFQHSLRISLLNAHSDTNWTSTNALSFKSIMKALGQLAAQQPNYPFIPMSIEDYAEIELTLDNIVRENAANRKTTKLIPPRVYAALIASVIADLKEIEPHLNSIKNLMLKIGFDPRAGGSTEDSYRYARNRVIKAHGGEYETFGNCDPTAVKSIQQLLKEFGLKAVLEQSAGREIATYEQLVHTLGLWQARANTALFIFSGMRAHEIELLPYDCLETLNIKGFGEVMILNSHTSKNNHGKVTEALQWVTDANGARAVKTLQAVAECFYALYGSEPTFPAHKIPLLLSPSFKEKKGAHYDYGIRNQTSLYKEENFPYPIKMEPSDIQDLEQFDGLRDWHDELTEMDERTGETVLGNWPFSAHQFRRSLAVYAARSGMVGLTDLANQLKHLSENMTAMYTENSAFAEMFIVKDGKLNHGTHKVVEEFRASQLLSMSDAFHRDNIESKSTGPVGDKIDRAKETGKMPKMFESRKATEKAMKNGQMSYRETIVGGCTKSEYCESYELDEIVPCVFDCGSASLNRDKLSSYARGIEIRLQHTGPNSPFAKEATTHLERIKLKLIEEPAEH